MSEIQDLTTTVIREGWTEFRIQHGAVCGCITKSRNLQPEMVCFNGILEEETNRSICRDLGVKLRGNWLASYG